jgi:predicted Zn finger-like uncharacterized protein
MILTCPACSTRYQAEESNFSPAGRNVRCAKCGHVWHQSAPEREGEPEPVFVAPEPPPPSTFEAAPRPQAYMQPPSFAVASQEQAPKPRSRWMGRVLLATGWAGLAAIVIVVGWTATVYRQQIVANWPQSASFYSKLGLQTNASGLQIADYQYHEEVQGGQSTLVVTGKLVNISGRELSVPQIRVTLSDVDRRELYHWTFVPAVISLRPGQTTRFVTRLSSPPAAARHLNLRFAKAGE